MNVLKGKTAIITGGSRGIGRACVLAFSKAGANVVFTYNRSKDEADALQKSAKNVVSVKTDVREYEQCRAVVNEALKKFKKLDVVVNNAGVNIDKALVMMTHDDWKTVIDTNLNGTFNMTRAAITTFMKQKGGCVINMSSVSGITGLPRQTNYSASKAGIIGFSKALAKEVAGYNVRVNTVCPGYIKTDMVDSLGEDVKKKILESVPQKRLGEPEEVADLCVFLASGKAGYITGEVIKIDGGLAI
ncbi:MAG: beta-ketoacyl-ACP reductase [Endomicrobiales bacterium]|nr:beta-ketoacyl-ACP reductase [Endomicrobiales bacterium]